MAPILKRKDAPTNESFLRTKKIRPQEDSNSSAPKKGLTVPKVSRAKDEEAAFPRGGASVLTPLEHKQIQIEATNDVLFEQEGSKKSRTSNLESERDTHVRKRQKKKENASNKESANDESEIAIESLNYKRIVPGSLVLGQVARINDHDIALSLPNNLTGYVPITSVSDELTKRVEELAVAEEDQEEEDVDLNAIFTIGRYLRAYVVSTSDEPSDKLSIKSKRRIELSLKPAQSNSGLTSENITVHNTVMASVVSVEDHGLVMDIGLQDSDMRGFMSSKEIGNGLDLSKMQVGGVLLCTITGFSSNRKIVKLSSDSSKIANPKKLSYLSEAPTIDAFLPGTAVETLVTSVTSHGITGKLMGLLDVTADLIHSGACSTSKGLENKYKAGSKIKARIICTFPTSSTPKLGISLLDHVLSLTPIQAGKVGEKKDPLDVLPLSTILEEIVVQRVEPTIGLFVNVGLKGVGGFVHISRIKDGKIETLSESSGPYRVGSVHRGRVIGYNSLDGVYLVSFEKSVLEQPFLRIEDLKVGEVVKGQIEKFIINATGFGGLLVKLADNLTGFVPQAHLADVQLLHPEKKFKEGMAVTARVLSTDASKQQIRLTLKKTLVNSDAKPFLSYQDIEPGAQSLGTIINILPSGAVVQFYGNVRGFLPVAEMSEAYIEDPALHFKVGQVVNVHVLKIDREAEKLVVSCKDPSIFGEAQQNAMKKLKVGSYVTAVVTEKSNDDISVELNESGLRAILPLGHLTDKSESKNLSMMKKIRVGQSLTDLVVLEKLEQKRLVILSNKPSLLKDVKEHTFLRGFEDVREKKLVHGFVKNITPTAVFVQFGGGLTGLLPKSKLPKDAILQPDFGLKKHQSVEARIISVDRDQQRFVLSMIDESNVPASQPSRTPIGDNQPAINPVDESITSTEDLTVGKLTKARIVSVKETQVNVQLADNIQGRLDVSEIFDSWDDIKDRKRPLRVFSPKQVVDVRVLGVHDARTHRFLPITHRTSKSLVFELSAKKNDLNELQIEPLSLKQVKLGSSWIAFVNNITDNCLWVNLSPNVRGRISGLNISDDVSLLADLESNFPIGSAVKVHVVGVDVEQNRLDLSARSSKSSEIFTFDNLSKGMVVPGKVTRVNERQIMVQLSENVSGPVNLPDFADDFSLVDTTTYNKNDIIRVCVVDIDKPNKKIRLSTRPSRVLNSSISIVDREISSYSDLKVNDVIRGFVKHVADNGVFVNLGGNVTGYVRISDLSDSYIKDWKSSFQIDQLVKGKVIVSDPASNHVQLSLKASVVDNDYKPPLLFNDMKIGQIVTGKIRKVEDFGVFIVVDGSSNVSGLCHRSEMAEKPVQDVKKLYSEGDAVKAIVLKIDTEKKRINFGLKASYFEDQERSDNDEDESDQFDEMQGVKLDEIEGDEDEGEDDNDTDEDESTVDLQDMDDIMGQIDQGSEDSEDEEMADDTTARPLNTSGFDWSADVLDQMEDNSEADQERGAGEEKSKKKRRRRSDTMVDRTADLDVNGPQSVSDFERLLLGQPDSSQLWIEYMAFQIKLSELNKAREVAERAIKTINIREETEKLNVWIALLNLENAYGSDDTTEEAFKRACQYNDAQEVHERMASIYIQSGKHDKADNLFQTITKKFSQSPEVWYNYAHFLYNTASSPDQARALLPRAIQALPSHTHLNLSLKFAALEFHSKSGSPERGRTIIEGILSTFPKRLDIWNQLLDLEIQQGDKDIIRGVFERAMKVKGLKPKGAKAWFKRWSEWEEKNGDKKSCERVKVKAEEWVRNAVENKNRT
ncbi:hypothetical protein F5884DRAFT_519221 [Xylogone sp. PMI_703]|nr:hypothetical protein F5884DRAFT_519221 [Xylogone sp. PMI_703]